MKFHEYHRVDIIRTISEVGYHKQEFSFIKRKGRIITQFNSDQSTFSYIMKTEISVDEISKDWIDQTYFEIKANDGKVERVENWETVIDEMKKWLLDI